MALNVCLDTEPFQRINVCGYPVLASRGSPIYRRWERGSRRAGIAAALVAAIGRRAGRRKGSAQSAISTSLQAVSSR